MPENTQVLSITEKGSKLQTLNYQSITNYFISFSYLFYYKFADSISDDGVSISQYYKVILSSWKYTFSSNSFSDLSEIENISISYWIAGTTIYLTKSSIQLYSIKTIYTRFHSISYLTLKFQYAFNNYTCLIMLLWENYAIWMLTWYFANILMLLLIVVWYWCYKKKNQKYLQGQLCQLLFRTIPFIYEN